MIIPLCLTTRDDSTAIFSLCFALCHIKMSAHFHGHGLSVPRRASPKFGVSYFYYGLFPSEDVHDTFVLFHKPGPSESRQF
jgi:hypothetical protein